MTKISIMRASLDDLRTLKDSGALRYDPNASENESLDRDFWLKAEAQAPRTDIQSVHLKVDRDVFEFFKKAGKGHLTRMQDVLRAYAYAHRDGRD